MAYSTLYTLNIDDAEILVLVSNYTSDYISALMRAEIGHGKRGIFRVDLE